MRLRHRLAVFIAAGRMGLKQVRGEVPALLGGFLMYTTLVVAYAGVFRWIPAQNLEAHHLTFPLMVWNLATTEFVLFCGVFGHFKELQYEIQSDQIHLALLRPCPVWVVKAGEWMGQYAARFLLLCLPSYALAYLVADHTALGVATVMGIVASMPLAGVIYVFSGFLIGCLCLWMRQAEPAYWIWQKSLFLLGAMLWPLVLYPTVLAQLVWLTPFPAILATVAGWIFDASLMSRLAGFLHQLIWAAAFVIGAAALNRAVLRRIQGEGE